MKLLLGTNRKLVKVSQKSATENAQRLVASREAKDKLESQWLLKRKRNECNSFCSL